MPKFTITSSHMMGFAAEKAEAGKENVKIITKCKLATSDEPVFHVWMRHISSLYLQNSTVPIPSIHKFLIVLHPDDTADVYINDFAETAMIKPTRDIQAGEKVYVSDIADITGSSFPDIEIKTDDAIIYGVRIEWRFSLYFDFGRKIELEALSKELGELRKEATFYSLYTSTNEQISKLDPRKDKALILTEGKSDWKHLLKAMDKLGIDEQLAFFEDEKDRGAVDLLKMCEHFAELPQSVPMIFIFDRDRSDILAKLKAKEKEGSKFQDWGNNVYSLYLHEPSDRKDSTHDISIEFLYKDEEIIKPNSEGRRIYLSDEFVKESGNHVQDNLVHCTVLNKLGKKITIIDSGVFNNQGSSKALSKNAFAEAILKDEQGFNDFDFSEFKPVFDAVEEIINLKVAH